jgi:hypothetical protein
MTTNGSECLGGPRQFPEASVERADCEIDGMWCFNESFVLAWPAAEIWDYQSRWKEGQRIQAPGDRS